MIQLVSRSPTQGVPSINAIAACGHSMGIVVDDEVGGVRNPDFSQLVPTEGDIHDFDSTTFVFDNKVASEYVQGTTTNPLVSGNNITLQSDGRIFSSDGNVTIKQMAGSDQVFQDTCKVLFEKMIDTVPSTVTLSDVYTPLAQKVGPITFGINTTTGGLQMTTYLRMLDVSDSVKATLFVESKDGTVASFPSSSQAAATGTMLNRLGRQGKIFNFVSEVKATISYSRFWFEV
ncbi:hypothetical protein BT69DRAFT_1327053, partial [Atractiella rhizophila]